jgi:hypothetical protein
MCWVHGAVRPRVPYHALSDVLQWVHHHLYPSWRLCCHFMAGWDDFAAGYVLRKRSPDAESESLLMNTDAAPDVTKGNSCV